MSTKTEEATATVKVRRKSPLLSVPEAAAYLHVSEAWIRRAVKTKLLPFHKIGAHVRFDAADLEAYLQGNRHEPAEGWEAWTWDS